MGGDLVTHLEAADRRTEPAGLAARPRVLVALSGPGSPQAAIEAGRAIAQALAAPLHGVLVWPTPITPCQVPRLLRLTPSALEGMVLDVDVGDPAERINAATRTHPVAFLVLIAERDGRDAYGLGELAAEILAGADSGAIVLRPGTSLSTIHRILVPIDGTPSMAAALAPAGELALRMGAALDVVMIEDAAAPLSAEPGAMAPPRYCDQPQHEWPAFSAELVQRLLSSIARWPPAVPTRFLLGTGNPAAEILRFVAELDPDLLALVWSCGSSREPDMVFLQVVRGTHLPLLVLRRGG
jgi:nucleotide-binding universal stress UspA family protein